MQIIINKPGILIFPDTEEEKKVLEEIGNGASVSFSPGWRELSIQPIAASDTKMICSPNVITECDVIRVVRDELHRAFRQFG